MWCNRADTTRTTQIFTLSHTQPILSTNIVELTYTIYVIVAYIYKVKKEKKCNLGVVFIVIDMHHYMPHCMLFEIQNRVR